MDDIQLTTWNDEDQFNLDTSRYQLKDSNHPNGTEFCHQQYDDPTSCSESISYLCDRI